MSNYGRQRISVLMSEPFANNPHVSAVEMGLKNLLLFRDIRVTCTSQNEGCLPKCPHAPVPVYLACTTA